jgi:PAS domain S-box-containing protein
MTVESTFPNASSEPNPEEHKFNHIISTTTRDLDSQEPTPLQQIIQTLAADENKLKPNAERMTEGVIIVSGSTVEWMNNAAAIIFDFSRGELPGQPLEAFFSPEDAEIFLGQLKKIKSEKARFRQIEFGIRRPNGQHRYFDVSTSSIAGAGDEKQAIIFRDVTDRRRSEEENKKMELKVQQAQKLESLGVLAGGIAHDFNNLLMTILGNASLALLELPSDSSARQSIEQIETAAIRAANLTNQLLTYSEKNRFVMQPTQLSRLVEEMVQLLQVSISKKVVLQFKLEKDIPTVEVEPTQIRQVIMNLITNASEAIGDEEGLIILSTGMVEADRAYLDECYLGEELPTGRFIFVEVSDTGCGMDAGTQAKIFDPFFTTKFTGRGLGLAAVLGIMRAHKGSIRVTSLPGQQTVFRILIPYSAVLTPVAEAPKQALINWRGQGLVLVVDDEEGVRKVVKMILEEYGFSILTATDGCAAIEAFKEHTSQVVAVILDLTMPRLDGLKTFQELRRMRHDVKVILSSGYSEEEAVSRFVGEGLAGFIQKPYNAIGLLEKMQRILGKI